MAVLTQTTTQEHFNAQVLDHSVIDATDIAKELDWDTRLIISTETAYECVDDLTGKQSGTVRLRKLVIAANFARKSGRTRFELPVLDSDLNLKTKLLEIKQEDGYTIINFRA